jgi:peroxiredoxin
MNWRLFATFLTLWLSSPALCKVKVGEVAPPFEVTLFDKRKVTLEELNGKVVLINYWATWCGPCKAEIPMMDAINKIAQDRGLGLQIVGVVTRDSVSPSQLKKLANALSYPLASSLKGKYGIIGGAVPSNYIIDRKGVLRYAKAGAFTKEELLNLVNPLLVEKP